MLLVADEFARRPRPSRVDDLTGLPDEILGYLEEHGVPMACLTPGARVPLHEIAYVEGRLAILLGSEKHGPSSRLSQAAKIQTTVAIHPEVESLNVSVAAALALYQRRFWNPVGGESRE